jgi:hypothetical protein
MIDGIFELVEAPAHATGQFSPDFCRWGCLPKLVARRVSAYVASGVPVDAGHG